MLTRTSHRWKELPGNVDKLNTKYLFESANVWGIPDLLSEPVPKPQLLIPYTHRVRSDHGYDGSYIHFFLDDYRFELTWHRPVDSLTRVQQCGYALTPDFSVLVDMPLALQAFNVYRNRWVGRFWQEHGIKIIPTVAWSDLEVWDLFLAGISPGSPIAISTVGTGHESSKVFMHGLEKVLLKLNPLYVVVYGKSDYLLKSFPQTDFVCFKDRWQGLKEARKNVREEILWGSWGTFKKNRNENLFRKTSGSGGRS